MEDMRFRIKRNNPSAERNTAIKVTILNHLFHWDINAHRRQCARSLLIEHESWLLKHQHENQKGVSC